VEAMQAVNVFLQRTFPRNRRHKEKRFQARVVKSLTKVASGRATEQMIRWMLGRWHD
jgi:hypothetical protein